MLTAYFSQFVFGYHSNINP